VDDDPRARRVVTAAFGRAGKAGAAFLGRTVRIGRREIPMAVIAPIVVGAALRVVFAFTDNVVGPDEAAYLGTGTSIWRGRGITYRGKPELHFPPLLPILLGGLSKLTPEPHHATVIITLVASVALIAIIGALAFRIAGSRARTIALWVAALSPGLSVNLARGTGGSEGLYTAVVLGAALVCAGSGDWKRAPSLWRAFAVGFLVGAAYLLRPEGILLITVFGVILGIRAIGGRVTRDAFNVVNLRRLLATALACAAGLLAFAAPYVRYLHENTGNWELTAKSVDVSIEAWRALAAQDRITRDTYLFKLDPTGHSTKQKTYSLTALARQHPRAYLGIVGENIRQLYKSMLSLNTTTMPGWRLFALPLLPFALYALWRHRSKPAALAAAGCLFLTVATVLGFFVLNRYLPPVVAALCVFAGVGLAEVSDRRRNWWIAIGVVASIFSVLTYFEGPHGLELVRERPEIQIAGRWLHERVPAGVVVMTRNTGLPYYMPENRQIAPPVGTVDQTWRYARYQNVRYFIFDPTTQLWRPMLAELLDGADHRAQGFETVHTFHVEGRTTIIFKIVPKQAAA
jgi:hypothetical protein